ncbi:hypothetical protein B0I35DRAFT_414890 [Stachybotrys elegans]|uniref:Uncharacterized protein n=1 Tax=Stachybotrys elegans TaxID=80388 RepID=A0A8K0SGQ7_9HYPO|nr:hypothetical protein B0I35DRAFT_414890 [Stachybotrys elegans]
MYKMFKTTTCNLTMTNLKVLEYMASFGNQSGSCVLFYGASKSTSVHVYNLRQPQSEKGAFCRTFAKTVNVGANVGGAALQVGSPFMGPMGTLIVPITGGILSVVAKMIKQTTTSNMLPVIFLERLSFKLSSRST